MPAQVPAWQVSVSVHAFASSQTNPSARGPKPHVPFVQRASSQAFALAGHCAASVHSGGVPLLDDAPLLPPEDDDVPPEDDDVPLLPPEDDELLDAPASSVPVGCPAASSSPEQAAERDRPSTKGMESALLVIP